MKISRLGAGTLLTLSLCTIPALAGILDKSKFNHPGNILISDQFNNRVIETDKKGTIVWSYGVGPLDCSANSVPGVNDAERVGRNTLMAGTGIPSGIDPNFPSGCVDNRVILVDQDGNIIWQYGTFGMTGSGPNQLNVPVQATYAPDKTVYITDQSNERVIQVDLSGNLLWQYGTTGMAGSGPNQLNNPNAALLLKNGNVLISDENNNRVIEVNKKTLGIVKTWTAHGGLSGVAFASLLPDGLLLVTDSNNNRIVTLDAGDNIQFNYATNTQTGSNASPLPTRAVIARGEGQVGNHGGRFLISDQFNNRVIEVDTLGNLITQYGNLNQVGYGTQNTQQGLYAPYDAKIIRDYKGLTKP
jgi:hypothetical protein